MIITILTLLSILMLSVYITYSYKMGGVPDSLSGTVYLTRLPKLFTLTMWTIGFLMMLVMVEVSDNLQWLAFISMMSLFGGGCTPLYKTEHGFAHYTCAIIAGLGSQIVVAANAPIYLSLWIVYIAYAIMLWNKNWLFWMQMTGISITFAYCLAQ